MKPLIVGLYVLFGLLLAGTITLAVRSYDGPVEERYSLRGERFLADREREEALGLDIRIPDRIATGTNRVAVALSTSAGPLRNASLTIRAMRIRGPGEDRESRLREEGAGLYTGELSIPSPGTWMLQLTVQSAAIDTVRNWTLSTGTRPEGPDGATGGIHAGHPAGHAGTRSDVAR